MSRVSAQPSTTWRSGWLLAALIAVAALAFVASQARPTAAQTAGDIELTKTVNESVVATGDPVTFTITIDNTSTDAVAQGDLAIIDILPELTDIVATPADPAIYSCDVDGDIVTCKNDEGAHPGETPTTITITGTAAVRGIHENQVTGGVAGDGEIDPASMGFTIESSNIAITKTVDVDQADPGEEIVFTITVTNEAGDGVVAAALDDVEIVDTLPAVFEPLVSGDIVITGDASYGCSITDGLTVTCDNDADHAVGDEAIITITATVAAAADFGITSNTATASAENQADIADSTVEFLVGEIIIERTITIEKLVTGEGAPELESVSGTITPHTPAEWTILTVPGAISVPDVGGGALAVLENSPGEHWEISYAVIEAGEACGDVETWTGSAAVVPAGEDDYTVCVRNTYIAPEVPEEQEYLLSFRWSLLAWLSPDMPIGDALRAEGQNEGGTNVFDDVTAIFGWDAAAQDWLAFFPAGVDIPSANDLETFEYGAAYWIAIEGPSNVPWTVINREADDEAENGAD